MDNLKGQQWPNAMLAECHCGLLNKVKGHADGFACGWNEAAKSYKSLLISRLEKLREKVEGKKREYTEENRYDNGKDMWGDRYANQIRQDIRMHNQALSEVLSLIQQEMEEVRK